MTRLPTSVVLSVFLGGAALSRADERVVHVLVNGQVLPVSVIECNGTIYAPIDAIAKALGAEVKIEADQVQVDRPTPPAPVTPAAAQAVPAIKGKLTYYNNVWEPRKPDVGAQVWLLTDAQARALAAAAGGTIAEPIAKNQIGWDVKLTEQFKFPRAIADEEGKFSFANVVAGSYLLIARSTRANGLAARDRQGKIRCQQIQVTPDGGTNATVDFGPIAYRE